MINKKINDITEADLQALIDNNVLEGKTIEYKRELPSNSDSSKKEFLADVTSFANASGGDLIFGIEEDTTTHNHGSLIGLGVDSIDEEKTRLDNIIRTGVEPRLVNVTIKPIQLGNTKHAILIRIPRSWISPHRVIFGGYAKFYARNSSGKYEMDVDELRIAFNLSETLIERIRNFKVDRIAKIMADETPVPLNSPHRIVLHLIHGNAFNPAVKYDVSGIYQSMHDKLPLIRRTVSGGRYNLDGLFTNSDHDGGKYSAYTQIYRNGIIEAVESMMLAPKKINGDTLKIIPSGALEKKIMEATNSYLTLLSELAIEPPIFIFLSLLNVKGYRIKRNIHYFDSSDLIDRDMLLLPEEIVESYKAQAEKILNPLFDLIWNACGEPRSLNFDENGNWIKRQ